MKPSVLFVDDDPKVLDGLRRMLHVNRNDWDMTFCLGARQALAALERNPHDVLVTDLLMPDMDGAALLQRVHALYPDMARLVLSGHSGKSLALKAARYAHQFLAKPLEAQALKAAITRILGLRSILTNRGVQTLVAKVESFPALPEIHRLIVQELQDANPSVNRIAELIARDMGLSSSILKLVNSAFFGLRVNVSNLHHAVNLLGLEILSALVLSVKLFSEFNPTDYPHFSLDLLWRHSLGAARLARAIARSEGLPPREQDNLFVAGVLHDVGKLALLSHGEGFYPGVSAECRASNRQIHQVEREILGVSHAELGAYLLSLWGMPENVVLAVSSHHGLLGNVGDPTPNAAMLHAANCLEHDLHVIHPEYDHHAPDMAFLERLGLGGRLTAWREVCETALEEVLRDGTKDPDR